MRILFLHDWQSTPGGVKPTFLKSHGHEVINPALPDDDFDAAVCIGQAECDLGFLNSQKETAMKWSLATTVFLIAAVLMHADVRGQEPSAPPPEMKVLERWLGTWKVENIGKVPTETRETSIAKRELVLGGRFVQETGGFDDKGKPGYMSMLTYDPNKKTYRWWFFHSKSQACMESTGTWDESSQTLTLMDRPAGGGAAVTTFQFRDESTLDFSMVVKDAGRKVVFHMVAEAVRQR
jgi:hypothetical protein